MISHESREVVLQSHNEINRVFGKLVLAITIPKHPKAQRRRITVN
jgi:hypothetical protein